MLFGVGGLWPLIEELPYNPKAAALTELAEFLTRDADLFQQILVNVI